MSQHETALQSGNTQRWSEENEKPNAGGSNKLEQVKATVSDKLKGFAKTLETRAQDDAGRNANLAGYETQAADWINRSANYIDELNPQQIKEDIATQVRRNPGKSLLLATAAGLVLGSLFRRR